MLDPLIPEPLRRKDGRGRPWKDRRRDAVLWVLRTGAPWADLPDRYPSYQTCHRRSIKGNVKKNTSPSTGSGEELLDFQPCQR